MRQFLRRIVGLLPDDEIRKGFHHATVQRTETQAKAVKVALDSIDNSDAVLTTIKSALSVVEGRKNVP